MTTDNTTPDPWDEPGAAQFDLFNQPEDAVVRAIIAGRKQTLTERFEEFHANNPGFYWTLVDLARRYISRTGANKVGIQQLIEVARWDHQISTAATDFKVNNDYAAFYARLIMAQEKDLANAFETRKAEEADAWISTLRGEAA